MRSSGSSISSEASGELEHTVILFLTDNGFSFGQHRIRGKRCQYDECIRTPFAARVPGAQAHDVPGLISNVDLAPTIADLAGVVPGQSVDGRSFAAALLGAPWHAPAGVFLDWAGDREIPAWQGVRTEDFAYIESADGTVELYDLTGAIGAADPYELRSRSADPRYRATVRRLAAMLRAFRSRSTGPTIDSRPSCNRPPVRSSAPRPRIAGVRPADRSRADARASCWRSSPWSSWPAFWPFGAGGTTGADGGTEQPSSGGGNGNGGNGGNGDGVVGPDSPIKHVIFMVKENRTFNNYFATYPGAEGRRPVGRSRAPTASARPGRTTS